MHKQCFSFKNVLNLRYLFFVIYLIFQKIKVMIIFKHLFVISIPSKTLATSSQYVRKLAIFALIYCMPRLKLAHITLCVTALLNMYWQKKMSKRNFHQISIFVKAMDNFICSFFSNQYIDNCCESTLKIVKIHVGR